MVWIPDPGILPELIKQGRKIWNTWRGYRVVAFGTQGVGKTTLWRHLQTGEEVQASEITPTADWERLPRFKLRDVKHLGLRARVLAVDVPGDPDLRGSWKEVLYDVKPHGIIFMLDHALDETPAQGFDPERLKEHYVAFEHVRDLVFNDQEVMNALQALLILVNKSDAWPESMDYGDILDASRIPELYDRFAELDHMRRRSQGCSALHGSNIRPSLAWMVKNFDKE